MNEKPKAAHTTKDVARLAGVSLGSVSRVVNGFANVTPEVREKVQKAMAVLGYRPNHAARTLRSRSSLTIGCMLSDVTNPLYAKLFRTLEDKLREAGYIVVLANSLNDPRWEVNILEMFVGRGMDGALIAPGNERDPEVLAAVSRLGIPAVIVDRDMAASFDHVTFDHASGVGAAVTALIADGHRDIAIVLSGVANRPMRRRLDGFRKAHAQHGLAVEERLIVALPASTSDAFASVCALLDGPRPPTAIFSLGTNMLGDVLSAVSSRGLRIPDDMSVVTMGEPGFTRSHVPAIATVSIDIDLAASEACRLLLERIHGGARRKPQRVRIETRFVANGSCGPVAAPAGRTASKGARRSR